MGLRDRVSQTTAGWRRSTQCNQNWLYGRHRRPCPLQAIQLGGRLPRPRAPALPSRRGGPRRPHLEVDALREGRPLLGAEPGRDDAADAALAELARQRAAMVPDDEQGRQAQRSRQAFAGAWPPRGRVGYCLRPSSRAAPAASTPGDCLSTFPRLPLAFHSFEYRSDKPWGFPQQQFAAEPACLRLRRSHPSTVLLAALPQNA